MSRIPRSEGSKPLIKTTTTVTSKTPAGGSKTTTTTQLRELQPCGAGQNESQASGCQPACPSKRGQGGQRSLRPPQVLTSAPRAGGTQPLASSTMRAPAQPMAPPVRWPPSGGASRIQPPASREAPPRRAPPVQQQAPAPGSYNAPAGYGPETRQGKDMTYSSPACLRGQQDSNMPKQLKYDKIAPPSRCARNRTNLAGTTMADNYNAYGGGGGPSAREEMVDRSALDQRMNQQMAEELFNMSSPEVFMVEDQAAHTLLERSMLEPDDKVFSKSQHMQKVDQQKIQTPGGMEPVIQQTYTEKRVERDDVAEKIVKNLAVTDIDEATGHGTRVTISEQQLDPDFGLTQEGKDVITVKETVSVTPLYTSTAKDVIHEVTTPKLAVDPQALAQMVEEENQDVENTLKMVPPDMALREDRYAVKKRLQKLRLNTESMILLEESVVNPTPTADEAMTETPPEAIANIMHTLESGVSPECAPDQVFHTLFEEKTTELSVILSSVGPGPLQDVIVPQVLTKDIHKESMTPDLTDLTNIYKNVTDAKDWPPVDIFESVMDDEAKSPKKGVKSRPFKPLDDEEMPWSEEDLEPIVNIVGAEPSVVLDAADIPDLEKSGKLETELSHGIEYFVEADPVQYMSRVQLRGSQPPPWFPGYIYALPEFPDVVKIARNPDEVFISSWKSCQPKLIPDHSMSIMH